MHVFCQFHLSFDEDVGAHEDGDVFPADVVEDIEGILGGVLEVGVAGRSGDAEEVDISGVGCIDDGKSVIEAWVAVQPDRLHLLFLHFWISNL